MSDELTGLNLVELYDKLVMPDAPVPVSMWPQTVGWIWLALGLVVLVGFVWWRLAAWHRATAYRRAALAELRGAADDPAKIATILKRTALSGFPRHEVAGLHGTEWLAFLDAATAKVKFQGSTAGTVLAKAPYVQQPADKDLPAMAETWIKTHRVQRKQL